MPLKLRDLVIGQQYREPLSGYTVRVRDFRMSVGGEKRVGVLVVYHNPITGRFVECELYDGEMELLDEPQSNADGRDGRR